MEMLVEILLRVAIIASIVGLWVFGYMVGYETCQNRLAKKRELKGKDRRQGKGE